jgi:hypothetical protein
MILSIMSCFSASFLNRLSTSPEKFCVKLCDVCYCKNYKNFDAGISYSQLFAKREGLPFGKDAVNFPCEEIATRLSGSLLLKCKHFKRPCSLTLRDAFSNGKPSLFQ